MINFHRSALTADIIDHHLADQATAINAIRDGGTLVYNAHWVGPGTLHLTRPNSAVINSRFDGGRVAYPSRIGRRTALAIIAATVAVGWGFAVWVKETSR